ncbi:unnamed protein product, partial [Chrysoparadoxa australica]
MFYTHQCESRPLKKKRKSNPPPPSPLRCVRPEKGEELTISPLTHLPLLSLPSCPDRISVVIIPSLERRMRRGRVLQAPTMTTGGVEVSVHTCPRSMIRELQFVFPRVDLEECLAIPTNQKASLDLVNLGDIVELEKDKLLNNFISFGAAICDRLESLGHWADYVDPCSGLPMRTRSNKVYSEVEGMQLLLRYQVLNAGGCKVLLHPKWGSAVYPATLFTTAP